VKRSGPSVTPVGENVIELYHSIEGMTRASERQEFQSVAALVRRQGTTYSIATRQRMLARHRKRFEIAGQLNSGLKRKSARMLKINQRARAEYLSLLIRAPNAEDGSRSPRPVRRISIGWWEGL
jgi:hypothetical protein